MSKGAGNELAGNVPSGIKRFVATPIRAPHHWVDDDRAIIQSAGRVVAQNHWIANALGMRSDPAEREQVMAIEARVI